MSEWNDCLTREESTVKEEEGERHPRQAKMVKMAKETEIVDDNDNNNNNNDSFKKEQMEGDDDKSSNDSVVLHHHDNTHKNLTILQEEKEESDLDNCENSPNILHHRTHVSLSSSSSPSVSSSLEQDTEHYDNNDEHVTTMNYNNYNLGEQSNNHHHHQQQQQQHLISDITDMSEPDTITTTTTDTGVIVMNDDNRHYSVHHDPQNVTATIPHAASYSGENFHRHALHLPIPTTLSASDFLMAVHSTPTPPIDDYLEVSGNPNNGIDSNDFDLTQNLNHYSDFHSSSSSSTSSNSSSTSSSNSSSSNRRRRRRHHRQQEQQQQEEERHQHEDDTTSEDESLFQRQILYPMNRPMSNYAFMVNRIYLHGMSVHRAHCHHHHHHHTTIERTGWIHPSLLHAPPPQQQQQQLSHYQQQQEEEEEDQSSGYNNEYNVEPQQEEQRQRQHSHPHPPEFWTGFITDDDDNVVSTTTDVTLDDMSHGEDNNGIDHHHHHHMDDVIMYISHDNSQNNKFHEDELSSQGHDDNDITERSYASASSNDERSSVEPSEPNRSSSSGSKSDDTIDHKTRSNNNNNNNKFHLHRHLAFSDEERNNSNGHGSHHAGTGTGAGGDSSSSSCISATALNHPTSEHNNFHLASPDSKYQTYACRVDQNQEDRAMEITLFSMTRPHMRAFHLAWMAFFVAFFTWFAITPLLSEVALSLDLTHVQIWNSSICAVAGSAITRIMIGPVCDKYGARWSMGGTLFVAGIPTMMTGLVNTAPGLNALRLVIGVAGSSFVTCQYWASSMFTKEIAGTASALVAGWGNLGGGVTQIVMGSALFPLFKWIFDETGKTSSSSSSSLSSSGTRRELGNDNDEEKDNADLSWRMVCIIPGLLSLIMAYVVVRYSDDSPKGSYRKRRRQGLMASVSAWSSLKTGMKNLCTWILFIQYGCCFGVEITMVNAAALYFKEEFGQSTESAAAIASIFGWMNLFARGVGGFCSDISNAKKGMQGRLLWQAVTLIFEGITVILFSRSKSLVGAIMAMVIFSVFVQAAEGSTFAIVPYVSPSVTGTISGIVGAGGNVGGVAFAVIFRQFKYRRAFSLMGWAIMGSSLLTLLIRITGHAGLCCGKDAPAVLQRRVRVIEQQRSVDNFENVYSESQRRGCSTASSNGDVEDEQEACGFAGCDHHCVEDGVFGVD